MKRLLTFALILHFASVCLLAQLPDIRNFATTDYRAGTQNWDIIQDSTGLMFIANNLGLLIYDGGWWDLHPVPNYSAVRSVHAAADRSRIYVGASDEFGFFCTNDNGDGIRYQTLVDRLPVAYRHFGEIWNIHELGSMTVFQCKNSLFVYHPEGKIKVFDFDKSIQTSAVVGNRILLSCKDGAGGGIFQFSGTDITPLPGTEPMQGLNVCAILPHGKDMLFVTDLDGIFIYDGHQCTPYVMDITPFLKANQVFCADIKQNYIAFGTVLQGIVVKNLKTGQTLYANRHSNLRNNTVLSMRFDDMNNLWLGLDNGLAYVLTSSPYHELLGAREDIGTAYTSVVKDDKLYLGTNQGLFYIGYPLKEGPVSQTPQMIQGIKGQVWMLENIDDVMLCAADKGAFVIEGTRARRIEGMDGTWNFVPLRKHPGYVISCDYRGLTILKREGKDYVLKNRLKGFNEVSNVICEDGDGTIWMSHWQKGIFHLWLSDDLEKVTRQELFNQGNGLLQDRDNYIYESDHHVYISSGSGFYRYNPKTRKLERDDERSRIFNNAGQSLRITPCENGNLWACKQDYCALAHLQKDGSYIVDSISFQELAPQLQIGFGRFTPLNDQLTLLNGNDGFYCVNSDSKPNPKHHPTLIRRIKSTLYNDSVLYTNVIFTQQKESVKIPHNLNSICIEYIQSEYRGGNAMTYQCYLKGYDKAWSAEQTATAKEYTGLSKGKYTFCVKARNRITGETDEASIEIEILPAWYETWWAYIIYTTLFIALFWLLTKYLRRKAELRFEEEKKEKEQQLKAQQTEYEMEKARREKELAMLKSEQLEVELKHKSSELADSTMNLIRKNDMLQELDENMNDLSESVRREDAKAAISKKISDIRRSIKNNMAEDENWDRFEQNFNLVYDNFMQKLTAAFPDLKDNDKKLCAYLRMGLSSKEMASLLNTTVRSIETARYRLRKKLNMESGENLTDFIQHFEKTEAE